MSKLYTTIATDLVDPDLEAKLDQEVVAEPQFQDIPNNLYAAIQTEISEGSSEVSIESNVKEFAVAVPNRLYTQIVPEKPSILAEERIFVYVPKVSINNAGIAKFVTEQFNIIDGQVSLNYNYLNNIVLTNLINLSIVVIVTELPEIGLENKLYLLIASEVLCTGYIWQNAWIELGNLQLSLSDYYTKSEIDNLLSSVEIDLSNYYTKTQIDTFLTTINLTFNNYYTKTQIDALFAAYSHSNDIAVGDTPPAFPELQKIWLDEDPFGN